MQIPVCKYEIILPTVVYPIQCYRQEHDKARQQQEEVMVEVMYVRVTKEDILYIAAGLILILTAAG